MPLNIRIPTVRDLMQRDVIQVQAAASVASLATLLVRNHISGAPVVNPDGKVIGVVSLHDIAARNGNGNGTQRFYRSGEPAAAEAEYLASFYAEEDDAVGTVADIMTPRVHHIAPDASVIELVGLMLSAHVHRVLVLEDDRLLGVVSTTDVMRAVPELVALTQPA